SLSSSVPGTLRDLLAARLDQLSPAARKAAQQGAALGREFRLDVLLSVSQQDERSLRRALGELLGSGLLHRRPAARVETYVFKHALIRDAAYESMVRAARESLHLRIGRVLRDSSAEVDQLEPELIALHFERGGDPMTAAAYRYRAGERSLLRAAYAE